jgi:hypothetical protein
MTCTITIVTWSMPLFGNICTKGADMRITNNPNVICPDDLYSKAELLRLEAAADLEEQIDSINRELQRLDDAHRGADMAGDDAQCSWIEDRMELLIELQCELQAELNSLTAPD